MTPADFIAALTVPCSRCVDGKVTLTVRRDKPVATRTCDWCRGDGKTISEFGEKLVGFLKTFGDLADTKYVDSGDDYVKNCIPDEHNV
jgi:hypothetical protein